MATKRGGGRRAEAGTQRNWLQLWGSSTGREAAAAGRQACGGAGDNVRPIWTPLMAPRRRARTTPTASATPTPRSTSAAATSVGARPRPPMHAHATTPLAASIRASHAATTAGGGGRPFSHGRSVTVMPAASNGAAGKVRSVTTTRSLTPAAARAAGNVGSSAAVGARVMSNRKPSRAISEWKLRGGDGGRRPAAPAGAPAPVITSPAAGGGVPPAPTAGAAALAAGVTVRASPPAPPARLDEDGLSTSDSYSRPPRGPNELSDAASARTGAASARVGGVGGGGGVVPRKELRSRDTMVTGQTERATPQPGVDPSQVKRGRNDRYQQSPPPPVQRLSATHGARNRSHSKTSTLKNTAPSSHLNRIRS